MQKPKSSQKKETSKPKVSFDFKPEESFEFDSICMNQNAIINELFYVESAKIDLGKFKLLPMQLEELGKFDERIFKEEQNLILNLIKITDKLAEKDSKSAPMLNLKKVVAGFLTTEKARANFSTKIKKIETDFHDHHTELSKSIELTFSNIKTQIGKVFVCFSEQIRNLEKNENVVEKEDPIVKDYKESKMTKVQEYKILVNKKEKLIQKLKLKINRQKAENQVKQFNLLFKVTNEGKEEESTNFKENNQNESKFKRNDQISNHPNQEIFQKKKIAEADEESMSNSGDCIVEDKCVPFEEITLQIEEIKDRLEMLESNEAESENYLLKIEELKSKALFVKNSEKAKVFDSDIKFKTHLHESLCINNESIRKEIEFCKKKLFSVLKKNEIQKIKFLKKVRREKHDFEKTRKINLRENFGNNKIEKSDLEKILHIAIFVKKYNVLTHQNFIISKQFPDLNAKSIKNLPNEVQQKPKKQSENVAKVADNGDVQESCSTKKINKDNTANTIPAKEKNKKLTELLGCEFDPNLTIDKIIDKMVEVEALNQKNYEIMKNNLNSPESLEALIDNCRSFTYNLEKNLSVLKNIQNSDKSQVNKSISSRNKNDESPKNAQINTKILATIENKLKTFSLMFDKYEKSLEESNLKNIKTEIEDLSGIKSNLLKHAKQILKKNNSETSNRSKKMESVKEKSDFDKNKNKNLNVSGQFDMQQKKIQILNLKVQELTTIIETLKQQLEEKNKTISTEKSKSKINVDEIDFLKKEKLKYEEYAESLTKNVKTYEKIFTILDEEKEEEKNKNWKVKKIPLEINSSFKSEDMILFDSENKQSKKEIDEVFDAELVNALNSDFLRMSGFESGHIASDNFIIHRSQNDSNSGLFLEQSQHKNPGSQLNQTKKKILSQKESKGETELTILKQKMNKFKALLIHQLENKQVLCLNFAAIEEKMKKSKNNMKMRISLKLKESEEICAKLLLENLKLKAKTNEDLEKIQTSRVFDLKNIQKNIIDFVKNRSFSENSFEDSFENKNFSEFMKELKSDIVKKELLQVEVNSLSEEIRIIKAELAKHLKQSPGKNDLTELEEYRKSIRLQILQLTTENQKLEDTVKAKSMKIEELNQEIFTQRREIGSLYEKFKTTTSKDIDNFSFAKQAHLQSVEYSKRMNFKSMQKDDQSKSYEDVPFKFNKKALGDDVFNETGSSGLTDNNSIEFVQTFKTATIEPLKVNINKQDSNKILNMINSKTGKDGKRDSQNNVLNNLYEAEFDYYENTFGNANEKFKKGSQDSIEEQFSKKGNRDFLKEPKNEFLDIEKPKIIQSKKTIDKLSAKDEFSNDDSKTSFGSNNFQAEFMTESKTEIKESEPGFKASKRGYLLKPVSEKGIFDDKNINQTQKSARNTIQFFNFKH